MRALEQLIRDVQNNPSTWGNRPFYQALADEIRKLGWTQLTSEDLIVFEDAIKWLDHELAFKQKLDAIYTETLSQDALSEEAQESNKNYLEKHTARKEYIRKLIDSQIESFPLRGFCGKPVFLDGDEFNFEGYCNKPLGHGLDAGENSIERDHGVLDYTRLPKR